MADSVEKGQGHDVPPEPAWDVARLFPPQGHWSEEEYLALKEVVSDDDRRRDLEVKRREYAQAGIPEYGIGDPQLGRIVVLRLEGDRHAEHGTSGRGQRAASALFPGLEVDVTAALAGRP